MYKIGRLGLKVDRDYSESHYIAKIYSCGKVYAATYAKPIKSPILIIKDYQNNRQDFKPFNESTNEYIRE